MLKKLLSILAVLALTAALAMAAPVRNIMSGEAKALLAKNRKVFLLDVRTPDEFRQARLKGAVLIPINEFERRFAEVPRDRPVLVYCAVGSRSSSAAGFLVSRGYADVYHMTDGIMGWYRNGYPIER
jgi:rhodanese-related sulfurtransferase